VAIEGVGSGNLVFVPPIVRLLHMVQETVAGAQLPLPPLRSLAGTIPHRGPEPRRTRPAKRTLPNSDIPCPSISIPSSVFAARNTPFSPSKMPHLYAEARDVVIASQPYITSEDGARPHQGRAMQDRAYGFPRRPPLDNRVNRNTRLLGATFPGKLNNYWLALFATVIAFSNSSGCSDPTRTLSPLDIPSCTPRPLMGLLGLIM
jgi:hypothetical protein